MAKGTFTADPADSCAVLGQFAALLADGRQLPEALRALTTGLSVATVVVRANDGELLGVAGDALQSVPSRIRVVPARDVWLEFPVSGRDGFPLGTLTVRGGRPSQLPALRAAASILGLSPFLGMAVRTARVTPDESSLVVADAEEALDELADALHDGPLQSLMVARYAADAAVRGGDPVAARDAVQAAVVELRKVLWDLRPRGGAGLVAALEQLASTLAKGGSELDLTIDGVDRAAAAGPAGVLAYRVVQESHVRADSNGRRVTVAVSRDGDSVAVEVTGAALPSPARWTRRAAALGCQLTLNGDRSRLVLPLHDDVLSQAVPSTFSTDVRTSP